MRTHNIPFSIYKRKSPLIIPNLLLWNFLLLSQERVPNIHGKRAVSVQDTEVLLYHMNIILEIVYQYMYITIKTAFCFKM